MLKLIANLGSFVGRRITLRQHWVQVPQNGHTFCMEVAEVAHAVAILAVDYDGKVALVENFRYPVGERVLELPAGKLEADPDACPSEPLTRAKAELEEEAGQVAAEWEDLGVIYSSPGITNERLYLFRCRKLRTVSRNLEATEAGMLVSWHSPKELAEMLRERKIKDAKTRLVLTEHLFSEGYASPG